MDVLLIDHYDSFTFNLLRLLQKSLSNLLGGEPNIVVRRCSDPTLRSRSIEADLLVLSPGPMTPNESGYSRRIVERHCRRGGSILGVCLGMQIVNEVFGGRTVPSISPTHGRAVWLERRLKTPLFRGLPSRFRVARYNSLACEVAKEVFLSSAVQQSRAEKASAEPMAIEHAEGRVVGLQFHPESFLSEQSDALLANFLRHYVLSD